jgi:hypothetical protein
MMIVTFKTFLLIVVLTVNGATIRESYVVKDEESCIKLKNVYMEYLVSDVSKLGEGDSADATCVPSESI